MQVITNNKPRDVLSWYDLTEKERDEFDYREEGEGVYVRYMGACYDLGEFISQSRTSELDHGKWDGIHTDTYFSAILCRFVDGNERVVMGRAYS